MKHVRTRITAIVLILAMTFSLMPMQAFAALADNDPAYNREMLEAIRTVIGSENEAELYYDMMEHYGLLEEDGTLAESWSISMDGEEISLSELREILAGEYDPDRYITVDGTPVTLADVQTMIDIEDYVAYIRDTYYSDGEWTQEQKDAYESLVQQVNTEGITLRGSTDAGLAEGGSEKSTLTNASTDQSARIRLTRLHNSGFRADLTGAAPGQYVSFSFTITGINCYISTENGGGIAGSSATIAMTAGEDGTATATFDPFEGRTVTPYKPVGTENCVLVLNVYDTFNALFVDGEGKSGDAMSVVFTWDDFTGSQTPEEAGGSLKIPAWTQTLGGGDASRYGWAVPRDGSTPSENAAKLARALELVEQGYYPHAYIQYNIECITSLDSVTLRFPWHVHPYSGSIHTNYYMDMTYDKNGGSEHVVFAAASDDTYNIPTGTSASALDWTFTTHSFIFEGNYRTRNINAVDIRNNLNWPPAEGYANAVARTSMLSLVSGSGELRSNYYDWYSWKLKMDGAELVFVNDTTPTLTQFTAYGGTYYPGEGIPILVRFSEPVKASKTTITVNGMQLRAIPQAGNSAAQAFIYPVQETDATFLTMDDYYTEDLFGHVGSAFKDERFETMHSPDNLTIETLTYKRTFTGIHAQLGRGEYTDAYTLNVTADISTNPKLTQWLLGELELDESEGTAWFNDLYFSIYIPGTGEHYAGDGLIHLGQLAGGIEGSVTGGKLTGRFYIRDEWLPEGFEEPLPCTVGLFLVRERDENGNIVYGERIFGLSDCVSIYPMKYIERENIRIRITVDYPDPKLVDIDEVYAPQPNNAVTIVPVDISSSPTIRMYPVLDADDYSFGDTSYTTVLSDETHVPLDQNANFIFSIIEYTDDYGYSSYLTNGEIASIDTEGYIEATGLGRVYPFVIAVNGSMGKRSQNVGFLALDFREGYIPYLALPNSSRQIEIAGGSSLPVYWNSNLLTYGATNFHVEMFVRGYEEDPLGLIWEGYTTSNSIIIPGGYLTYWYDHPDWNYYTVRVTPVCYNYYEDRYEPFDIDGNDFHADRSVTVRALPAQVSFGKLSSYYVTDTVGTVEIPWTIQSFDQYSNGGNMFEMQVVRSGDSEPVAVINDPGTYREGGAYTGSYTLHISDFEANTNDPTSFRQIYTVTIRAKNGKDSTWSYDSFLLYVYDEDALKILVDGVEVPAEDGQTPSILMSNVEAISNMTSSEILGLNRDISLHNEISANYGEFAWAELADRLAWDSSDDSVATINYQQGYVYEDIRNFTYTAYRPTTDFVLSGLSTGQTEISATHTLTGMEASLDVTVETLKDKLYIFQFYPKTTTKVQFVNGLGETVTVSSDNTGALAHYEESGIASTVHCKANYNGDTYLGSFKAEQLLSGERDSTKLDLYPCNYLTLRQAAYAYVYLKNPNGTPYTGSITFRGGVYYMGVYQPNAAFALNTSTPPSVPGSTDQTIQLGASGKLEIVMDQTQWNTGGINGYDLEPTSSVRYVFLISKADSDDYYPLFINEDANISAQNRISSGSAIVNFRSNPTGTPHPFLVGQYVTTDGRQTDVLRSNTRVGLNDNSPQAELSSMVLWWGEPAQPGASNRLQLFTADGEAIADGPAYSSNVSNDATYPFISDEITTYTVELSEDSLEGVIDPGGMCSTYLEYYRDGVTMSRKEDLGIQICNLTGAGSVADSPDLENELKGYGSAMSTNGSNNMGTGDQFVNAILRLVSREQYTDGDPHLFEVKIAPTSDPTRFLGFIQANYGDRIEGAGDSGFSFIETEDLEISEKQDVLERIEMAKQSPSEWGSGKQKEMESAMRNRGGGSDWSVSIGGYMEVVIYYDFHEAKWSMQPISGGFHVGGGVEYSQSWNYMVGPIPFTTELTAGGNIEVSMDAITAAYMKTEESTQIDVATEYLTQLRIYLYLRLFAGVGFDYSVVAFKLGIFGLITLDMQFAWLNRPYLEKNPDALILATGLNSEGDPNPPAQNTESANLSGQHIRLNGQIGIELIVKFLFFEIDWVLLSYSFDLFNESFNSYDSITEHWENNQKNLKRAIEALLNNGDAKMMGSAGGRQLVAVSMAPTLEDRDYLENGDRQWSYVPRRGPAFPINNLESNTYPYANPELTRDGQLMVYVTDQQDPDITKTRAAYAVSGWPTYEQAGIIDDGGFGDSELAVDGTSRFAAAAWARQTVDLEKEAGSVLDGEEKMSLMNGTEIYASIYSNGEWATTRLTENESPDVAPTVAVSGDRAIVAWRSVTTVDADKLTEFEQDVILYKIYENRSWSDTGMLYNGTSGGVKAITSAMMDDGTAAVAYTLDKDDVDTTITDREIVYAVVGRDGEMIRNVCVTNNDKVDENPQLAAVTFPQDGQQHFLLGWYTQNVNTGKESEKASGTESDIGMLDFDANGLATQLIPESMSKVATAPDVSVSSNFRFTKNAESITDLSLVWVERDSGTSSGSEGSSTDTVDKDVLKSVKFYFYGVNNDSIGFTGALKVAEMGDATLIDHFDVYAEAGTNLKAVVLGTTYGADGVVEKTGQTAGGDTVTYYVPSTTYAMYVATDTYQNAFEVPTLAVDYEAVRLGADTLVGLSVENKGIEPITDITVNVGGYETEFNGLLLLPGHQTELWAAYTVPEDGVEDPAYTVSAMADSDGDGIGDVPMDDVMGTVMMDLPDLQVIDAAILEEIEGRRTIQIKLNNRQDSFLEGSGRSVKLSFWNDATFEAPIDGLNDVIISDDESLKMIDEGGYSTQVVFDVGAFLANSAAGASEISENGVPVYIKAEVLQTVDDKAVTVPEPVQSNNYATVTCENMRLRTGLDVLINSDVASDGGVTTVTVHLQNTRLTETKTGNLIVYLLDENGRIIDEKQSYDENAPDSGLISLGGEAKTDVSFTFDQTGASVRFAYTDLLMGDDSAQLSAIDFQGAAGLTPAIFEDGAAELAVDDLTGPTGLTAVAASPLAEVSVFLVSGEEETAVAGTSGDGYRFTGMIEMTPGTDTVLRIHVDNPTAEGETEADYVLTIHNNGAPEISASFVILDETTAVLTASAQPSPASPGYPIAYHWYACDENGENLQEIETCTGADTAQATVTEDFSETPSYYVCEIVRTKLDGTLASYFCEPQAVILKHLIIIRPQDASKVYGDADPAYRYLPDLPSDEELEALGYPSFEVWYNLWAHHLVYELTYEREPGENVGEYVVTPQLSDDYYGDYYFVRQSATLTITPAPVTVAADIQTKNAGDPDPELTVTVTGLKNGESEDVLSYTVTREPGEEAGTYAITVTGEASQGNYTVTYAPSTLLISDGHAHDGVTFQPWNDPQNLPSEGGSYYLECDVTLNRFGWGTPEDYDTYSETGEKLVTDICLNGHTISGGPVIVLQGSQLNLYDDGGTGTISGAGYTDYAIVDVMGELNMYGGTITDSYSYLCGAVSVREGTFNLYGGTITGNGYRVTEYDGEIYESTSQYGGGVYLEAGTFNMYGGTISGNAAWYGAGIGICDQGWRTVSCTISGGTIEDNTAKTGLGNAIWYEADFETLEQIMEWCEDEEEAQGYYSPDSLAICGGEILESADGIAVAAQKGRNFSLSGDVYVTGAIVTAPDRPIVIADALSGSYQIALVEPGEEDLIPAEGVFTSGLGANGIAGSFVSFDPDYVVTTAESGEAQLVEKSSVTVYAVTFQDDDGTVLAELEMAEGETPVYPGKEPAKEGFTFLGWEPE
nr:hypothetical protein [Clostridia bacterium]